MDNDTRTLLKRTNAALIRYPRFKELHQDIRECQEMSQLADEPQCMSLEGITGAGKSTLIRDYAAAFPRIEEEDGARVPVFYVETPSPVTVKGMAAAMLSGLGDPAAHRGTLWAMNFRLIKLMIACQVELAILDDFHHLIDKETNRVLEQVSDWLKVLIKETGVTFLVVGMEGKVEPILQANAQLSRLFAVRETLEPFPYDPTDEDTIRQFARFVQYAETTIETTLPETLPRLELLYRLHYATDGIVGNLMNLLRYATLLVRQRGKKAIDLPILAAAFDKRLSKHLKGRVNPFEIPETEQFTAPVVNAAGNIDPGPQQGRRRKRSAESVLTAS
jgi:hypothetical protein